MTSLDDNQQIDTQSFWRSFYRKYVTFLGYGVSYQKTRWIGLILFAMYIFYRICIYDYMAILYFEGLYVLYLTVQYYTPSGLPDPDQDDFSLTQQYRNQDSDRPIIRTITQFNLWQTIFYTLIICYFCTLFDLFLVPVYWPFLVIYFLLLVIFAVRKHYKHMKKYGYGLQDFYSKRGTSI